MKLLTQALRKQIPQDQDGFVYCKFFTPDSNYSWYVMEFDPEDEVFFGFVDGHELEYGYFSLYELETTKGPLGLPIERDRYFEKQKAKELIQKLKRGAYVE